MKRYYLAYGSNLNVKQMVLRCPDAKPLGTGEIAGYRLLFKGSKSGAYLTIEPQEGAKVPVAVWEVSEADEKKLDRYEGFPAFYYKKELELTYTGIKTGKIDWVRKLTSRKLWTAVGSFVSLLIVALGYSENTAVQITSLIMAGASVVAYIIGEGLVDSASITEKTAEDE